MNQKHFPVTRFIKSGCYSLVYEARSVRDKDKDRLYALKRIFLYCPPAVKCALREHRTFLRLAVKDYQSPFICTLFYSFQVHDSPILLITKGSGFTLADLTHAVGLMNEEKARFYASEIVCGLEHLHSMQIIHLDLKHENILIADSGHILITDFDRSYDATYEVGQPDPQYFRVTPRIMAPEIANQIIITTKADIWSLGIIIATLVAGPVRPTSRVWRENHELAKKGDYRIKNFEKFSKPLQSFLNVCLRPNFRERPYIAEVKTLRFFKRVSWDAVLACQVLPPYLPSELDFSTLPYQFTEDPCDPPILEAAYGPKMPLIKDRVLFSSNEEGGRHVKTVSPNYMRLGMEGLTPLGIKQLLSSFDFVHPTLRCNDEKEGAAKDARSECDVPICRE